MPLILIALVLFSWCQVAEGREIPGRNLPAPETASSEFAPIIAATPPAHWNLHPASMEEWEKFVKERAAVNAGLVPGLLEQYHVTCREGVIGGVPVFYLDPTDADKSRNVLLHIHGGGYVLNPGRAGIGEGIIMAGLAKIPVISVDYRLAPKFPFPAALEDCVAVYEGLLRTHEAKNIGVFGTSTGGGLCLALLLKLRELHLPMPGAVAALTPWTDLSKTGDSYLTNEGVDNVLVSYDGWLGEAAKAYAGNESFSNPLLSPVYGEWTDMPPILLVTGTRDLFLSNTVRMHRKLRDAGNVADLLVYESQSHGQYNLAPNSPEGRFHFGEMIKFLNRYLGK